MVKLDLTCLAATKKNDYMKNQASHLVFHAIVKLPQSKNEIQGQV